MRPRHQLVLDISCHGLVTVALRLNQLPVGACMLSQDNAFSVKRNKRDWTIDSHRGAEVHLSVDSGVLSANAELGLEHDFRDAGDVDLG